MNLPNRLANEGEVLVTHKFSTGSIGFVSSMDLCAPSVVRPQRVDVSFWSRVKNWFAAPPSRLQIPAVCIPPGARLRVQCVPATAQRVLRVEPGDDVIFTEITATWNQFRDGLRMKDGQEILLQSLGEGVEVQVVNLASAEGTPKRESPRHEELAYNLVRHR
jgi:hypothetical protein